MTDQRKFITTGREIRDRNGILLFDKNQRIAVVRDFGAYGVSVKDPRFSRQDIQPDYRLFNHELKVAK